MEEAGGNLRLKSGVKYVDLAFDYRFFLAAQAQQNFVYSRKQLVGNVVVKSEQNQVTSSSISQQPGQLSVLFLSFIFMSSIVFVIIHAFLLKYSLSGNNIQRTASSTISPT